MRLTLWALIVAGVLAIVPVVRAIGDGDKSTREDPARSDRAVLLAFFAGGGISAGAALTLYLRDRHLTTTK